jgi:hypothetical protein
MTSFKNPLTPAIGSPTGIDKPIQELAANLASLSWLGKSFARAWTAQRKDATGKVILYPEVWQGLDQDLLNVMPNDNLRSQSFFKVDDPVDVLEYRQNLFFIRSAPVSIIFWGNLKEIHSTLDYRFIEILKAQMMSRVRAFTFSQESGASIEIVRTWEEPVNVFRGYTIVNPDAQELVHPYAGFRLECRLVYRENCPLPSLP